MTAANVDRLTRSRVSIGPSLAVRSKRLSLNARSRTGVGHSQAAITVEDFYPLGAIPQTQRPAANDATAPKEFARPDALTIYRREAAQVLFLTRAEETALARRIQNGDKHRFITTPNNQQP